MKLPPGLTGLILGAGVIGLMARPPGERSRGPYQAPLLPRVELVRVLGAGQQSLVADYFWLQAIQASGRAGHSLETTRFLDLFHYADLVTRIDPGFYKVYEFAGTSVPTNLGRETYINVDEGIQLLERGVDNFPDDWRMNFHLANALSYLRKEHSRAARILERAAHMDGAPGMLKEMATRLLAVEGDFEVALELAQTAARTERDPQLRVVLKRRVLEIEQEQILRKLDLGISRFVEAEGRQPTGLREVQQLNYLSSVLPPDPMDGDFYLGKDGRAYSTANILRLEAIDYEKRRMRTDSE